MTTKCAKVAHVGWSGDQGFEHARQMACCIAPNSTGRTMKKNAPGLLVLSKRIHRTISLWSAMNSAKMSYSLPDHLSIEEDI